MRLIVGLDKWRNVLTDFGGDAFDVRSLSPWSLACAVGTFNHLTEISFSSHYL